MSFSDTAQIWLAFIAAVASVALAVVDSQLQAHQNKDYGLSFRNVGWLLIGCVSATLGVILGIVAIIGLLTGEMDDGMVGLVFVALIPAVQITPRLRLSELRSISKARTALIKKSGLELLKLKYCRYDSLTNKNFLVIRYGIHRPNVDNIVLARSEEPYDIRNNRSLDNTVTFKYIRGRYENQYCVIVLVHSSSGNKVLSSQNFQIDAEFWYGDIISFSENWIELKDKSLSECEVWWKSTLNASRLVTDPTPFYLPSFDAACNALLAILEIIMVSDIVVGSCKDVCIAIAKADRGFNDSLTAVPGSCCSKLIQYLNLPWLQLHDSDRRDDSKLKNFLNKRWGRFSFLLQVIAEKSTLFTTLQTDRLTANELIEKLRDVTKDKRKEYITKWLDGWSVEC